MADKNMNRWIIVACAILIQLALGSIYAWSAFTTPLQKGFGFSKTETNLIFSAGLASFGIMTILGGRIQQKIKPRWVALAGGTVLGLGYILGGLMGDSFMTKLIFIGFIGGAGIGLGYVVPIAVGVKWFPDKKGLLTGLAVAGFGFGALLWIMVANPPALLGINGLIDAKNYVDSVNKTFLIYGIAYFVLVGIGSLAMINPPEGYSPKGWDPSKITKAVKKSQGIEVGPLGMLTRWQFYVMWSMFMVGALAGLMVIGNVKNFAISGEGFTDHGFNAADAADFGIIAASICLPILNGTGRIVWGVISDKIGRKYAFALMFSLQALSMSVFFLTPASPIVFFVAAASIGFNFGGNFALFPATTADYFGNKTVGLNYGIVFTSYAAGGIAGPLLAGIVQDKGWSFTLAFLPAAILCLIAVGLALLITAPKQK